MPRPESEWIRSTNPRLRIVPPDLWDQVQQIHDRRKFTILARSPNSCLFTDLLLCGICGRALRARKDSHDRTVYQCVAVDKVKRSACNGAPGAVPVAEVEDAVLVAMRDTLLTPRRIATFAAELARQSQTLDAARIARRGEIEKELAKLQQHLFDTTDQARMEGLDHDDVVAVRARLKGGIKERIEELAAIGDADDRASHARDGVGSMREVQASVDLIRKRLPFRPADDLELALACAIRDYVNSVVVNRSTDGGPTRLTVSFRDPLGLALPSTLANDEGEGRCLPPVELVLDLGAVAAIDAEARKRKIAAGASELARSGRHDMPDHAWSIAAAVMDASASRCLGSEMERRRLLDGLLFAMRTGTAFAKVPEIYGTREALDRFRSHISYHWIWDDILDQWQEQCPEILRGCEISRLSAARTYRSTKRRVVGELPTAQQLRTLAVKEKTKDVRDRMVAVAMVLDGVRAREAGSTLGLSQHAMHALMSRFRVVGVSAFQHRGAKLTYAQATELLAVYRSGINPDNPQKRITYKNLLTICEDKFSIHFANYKSLHGGIQKTLRA